MNYKARDSALVWQTHMTKKIFDTIMHLWVVLALDIILIVAAHVLAYLLRFEGVLDPDHAQQLLATLPLLIVVKLAVFYSFGLYKGMWRYTGLPDMFKIMQATIVSSMLILATLVLINHFHGLSRSIFILDGMLTFCFIIGHRTLIRCTYQYIKRTRFGSSGRKALKVKKRILLIGAGDAAERLIREIQADPSLPYTLVGLVDDDPGKQGRKIHGIPVLDTINNLSDIVILRDIQGLMITIAAATGPDMKKIVTLCQETGIPFKTLPGISELIKGRVSVRDLREVSYEDLLGRPAVNLDDEKIGNYIHGNTILVTGAGGSIGSELCRQILRFNPQKLILLDAGEENLYNIQMELQHELNFKDHVAILGKIQNRKLLDKTFSTYKPAVVFHAAAYKHVPLVENNPWEAVFNNVFGTRNVIETSVFHNVQRFVLVSTDKAVRPTNVMGATKRLTELLMLSYSGKQLGGKLLTNLNQRWRTPVRINLGDRRAKVTTKFIAVRFGNVLGSSGSVIPLFKRQIKKGGPVTVTDPEMTRYFMSIEEATQLILQAGSMAAGGEIFILKMGTPVKIDTMARELIKLSDMEPDTDIEIKYTGTRPGEKLYEELITEGEGIVPTGHEKIMVLRGNGTSYKELERNLRRLAIQAKDHNGAGIKRVLHDIIPEYTPDEKSKTIAEPVPAMAN